MHFATQKTYSYRKCTPLQKNTLSSREMHCSFEIPPAIYRSAFAGIPESAPASAFGVLCGDSQKVPRRVLTRVPGKVGVPQALQSTPKALAGALSGIPAKALL